MIYVDTKTCKLYVPVHVTVESHIRARVFFCWHTKKLGQCAKTKPFLFMSLMFKLINKNSFCHQGLARCKIQALSHV